MTDKLITHEEAVKNLLDGDEVDRDLQYKYIRQQEQFAKDVARYFELDDKNRYWKVILTADEELERVTLNVKLSKVGDEK